MIKSSILLKLLAIILLSIPIYAYVTFYMVFPVVCPIPLGNVYFSMLYAFLIAFGIGMVSDSLELGYIAVIVASMTGYVLAIIYEGFPALLYGYGLYLSDVMIFQFIGFTWLPLFSYIAVGLPGIFVGLMAQSFFLEDSTESDDV